MKGTRKEQVGSECPSVCGTDSSYGYVHTQWENYHIISSEMGGACGTYGEKRNAYRIFVGEGAHEGKRQL